MVMAYTVRYAFCKEARSNINAKGAWPHLTIEVDVMPARYNALTIRMFDIGTSNGKRDFSTIHTC